ncbi:hypothetical protein MSIBF_A1750021 [groundwater metagenome]|uniref:Uncharacterized protein n=1 Tax=groundwater metagenome TaxID=717931 RepID=A0A098E7A2_9ZZZZ
MSKVCLFIYCHNSKGSFLVIPLHPVELITQNYVKLPYTYDIIANLLTFYAYIYYHVKP